MGVSTGLGAFAGGLARGIETGERMRLQRERDARDSERHGLEMQERRRVADQRGREESAWEELNAAIARRTQPQASQAQAPEAAAAMPAQEAPAAPIDQGNGVETTPLQDASVGLERRALPADAAAAPGAAASDPGQKIGFQLYRNTNLLRDPEFLNEAAQIFTKARMPEGVKWLERGYKAQQENAVDALKALAAGDVERATAMFNASGSMKIAGLQQIADGPEKGKWQVSFEGGSSRVIDPNMALRSFLDPKAFFEVAIKERDNARAAKKDEAEADLRTAQAGYWRQRGKIEQQNADSLAAYRETQGEAATTRANRPPGTGGGRSGGNPDRERNALSARIDSQLRRQMHDTAPTDTLGKKQANPLSEFIPDIREAVMQDVDAGVDPNVAFNNRYVEFGQKFDQAQEVLGQAFDKAKRAGSGILSGRSDSVASLRASIAELEKQGISVEEQRRFAKAAKRDMGLFNEAAQGMASGRASAPSAAPSGPAGGAPKTPKTRAEVEAYEPGTRYINPADGRVYTKKDPSKVK